MQKRILVAYASPCGSTAEVAEEIGKVLAADGTAVDVLPVTKVADLTPYQAVIVGSGVRGSGFLADAVSFVAQNRQSLSRLPVAYFAVCGMLHADTPKNRKAAQRFTDRVRKAVPEVVPVATAQFAGKFVPQGQPLPFRILVALHILPSGDWRNWPAIRAWAEGLRSSMAPAARLA